MTVSRLFKKGFHFYFIICICPHPRPLYTPISVGPNSFPSHFKKKLNERHHRRGRFVGCLLWPLKWRGAGREKQACGLLCSYFPGLGRAVDSKARPLGWVTFQSIKVCAYPPTKQLGVLY